MLDVDDRAENRRLAAEVALPEAIADESDFAVAGLDIDIRGGEAKDGLDTEDGEVVGRDVVAAQAFRRTAVHERDVIGSGGRDASEDVRPLRDLRDLAGSVDAPGAARLIGHAYLRGGKRLDVVIGEGVDEHAIGDAVDRGGGADAESEREHRGNGEAGGAAQLAEGIAQVGDESGHG
jgi:hypothetical protein